MPSVGGYASIVNGHYNTVTDSHSVGELNISALGEGKLDGLALQDLVTVPQYFMLPIEGSPATLAGVQSITLGFEANPVLSQGFRTNFNDTAYPSFPAPRGPLSVGTTDSWFFGESVDPVDPTLLFTSPASAASLRFGSVLSSGHIRWGPTVAVRSGARRVDGSISGDQIVGVAVQVVSGAVPGLQALVRIGTQTFELDGSLSTVVHPGPWRYQGSSRDMPFSSGRRPPIRCGSSRAKAGWHRPEERCSRPARSRSRCNCIRGGRARSSAMWPGTAVGGQRCR